MYRHPRRFACLALVLTTLLGGCASAPVPKLDTATPTQWRHHSASSARTSTDLHGWWKAFDDPALNRLVDQALKVNLDVAQARERLLAERALYSRRQAPNLPQLRIRTDDPIDPDASASYFVIGFDAIWELPLFGRAKADQRIAAGNLGDAMETLRAARVSLVAEVARDWIQLRAAQRREQLLQNVVAVRRRQLTLVQTRVRLKLDDASALARARADLADARGDLAGPRAAADAAAQRLAVLLARSEPDPSWLQPAPLPALGPRGPIEAPARLLRSQPQIARAEARVILAAGELGIAHADRFPRIGIGTSTLWSTNIVSNRPRGSTHKIGTLGPLIDIPLLDWGLRKAHETARSHQLKSAVLAYRKAVLTGISDVETALGNLQQQRHSEATSVDACHAWQQALKAQQTRRKLGLSSDLDSVDVEVANARAQLRLANARSQRDIAYVALYKALGGAPPLPKADDARAAMEAAR